MFSSSILIGAGLVMAGSFAVAGARAARRGETLATVLCSAFCAYGGWLIIREFSAGGTEPLDLLVMPVMLGALALVVLPARGAEVPPLARTGAGWFLGATAILLVLASLVQIGAALTLTFAGYPDCTNLPGALLTAVPATAYAAAVILGVRQLRRFAPSVGSGLSVS